MAAISMQSVDKHFAKTKVIRGVDLAISDGEFCVFVGPSGCGKSTLLRLIAGLEEVSNGQIAFDQQDVTELAPAERGVAMVFQSYALYPHMTVYDNMAFGLKISKANQQEMDTRVKQAAATLQIEHLLQRKPKELSGGQRQRVAIGRAIVRKPGVFLFDEPLSNLDAALRVQMRLELKRLHRDLGTTMIYVTHDQVEAMTMADRIVVLNGGSVEQVGAPLELYQQPRNEFVAGFIGSPKMNFLPASVKHGTNTTLELTLDTSQTIKLNRDGSQCHPGQRIRLGIRPEHLSAQSTDGADLEGELLAVEQLGAETFIHVDYGGQEAIVCKCPADSTLKVGDRAALKIAADSCYLFDESGLAIS